jgi:hypothetical protein
LELFADVAEGMLPQKHQLDEIYDGLLENFNVCDGEKLEQLQRLNEVRNFCGNTTRIWCTDQNEIWMTTQKEKIKIMHTKRTIPTIFRLKQGEEETIIEASQEEEETDLSEWTQEVDQVTELERKKAVSGLELDIIKTNFESLKKQLKNLKGKNKKFMKDISFSCENAAKTNQMLMEKLDEISKPTEKQRKKPVMRNPQQEEEDSNDEMNNFSENSQTQSENELPNDIIILKTMMLNEINEDIKKTVPRIERKNYAKIKSCLKPLFDDITNVFKRINENEITGKDENEKEIIELGFQYMIHRLKRHIAEKIGKDKVRNVEKLAMRLMKENQGKYDTEKNAQDLKDLEIEYDQQLSAIHIAIGKMKEIQYLMNEIQLKNSNFMNEEYHDPLHL